MVFRIIFALVIAAFGLLVFAERLGLPAQIALDVTLLLVLMGGFATALAATTTRLSAYLHQPSSPVALYVLALGSVLLACLPPFSIIKNAADMGGFLAGFALASLALPQFGVPTHRLARNGVLVASGLVALLLVLSVLPSIITWLESSSDLERWEVILVLIALPGITIFLGGAGGLIRLAGFVATLFILMVVVPLLVEATSTQVLHSSSEIGVDGVLHPLFSAQMADQADMFAIGMAFAMPLMPFLLRVEKRLTRLAVMGGILACIGSTALFLLLFTHAFRDMLQTQLAATAPVFWPPFVFEDRITGWITVCGVHPYDVADILRACISQGRDAVPGIQLDIERAAPAFAAWRGWPIVFGMLANVLAPAVMLCALALFMHHVVACCSEALQQSGLFPYALKSVRLALNRFIVMSVVVVALIFAFSGFILPIKEAELALFIAMIVYGFAYFIAWLAYIPGWYLRIAQTKTLEKA